MFGFIITRHVNSDKTNLLWMECIQKIRKYYPTHPIVVIDDNSDETFVTKVLNIPKCIFIKSEFPKRGELLPYYYLLKNKWFSKAVILHDSVFLQQHIPRFDIVSNARIWSFNPFYENYDDEQKLLGALTNNEALLDLHTKKKFWGMFGVMSVISLDFLTELQTKYNFLNLIPLITDRHSRMCLERVMGVLFSAEKVDTVLFGTIHAYCKWGATFEEYKKKQVNLQRPLIKVWSGR